MNINKQTSFLEKLIAEQLPVTVFLQFGVKLQGVITAADDSVIFLKRDGHTQMIYIHAISTIMPVAAVTVD